MTNQPKKKANLLEATFEAILWNGRFGVILAVVFGLISSLALFILGSWEILHALQEVFILHQDVANHELLVIAVIGAVDLYLIAIVLLIFSFGVYELFISRIDVARSNQEVRILEISSLDQLKNKILKVVIMVLIVSFFQRVLEMHYDNPLHLLYLALSIFVLTLSFYFMNKNQSDNA